MLGDARRRAEAANSDPAFASGALKEIFLGFLY